MPFAAPGALSNLGPFVLGNHALELHQQLIFGRSCGRRLQEYQLDSIACELFRQQDLIGIFTAQAVRRVDQHGCDLACSGQVSHGLQARAQQRSSTIAFVLKLPVGRNKVAVSLGVVDQSRSLALNGVILLLLIRRDTSVDGCRSVHTSPPGIGV